MAFIPAYHDPERIHLNMAKAIAPRHCRQVFAPVYRHVDPKQRSEGRVEILIKLDVAIVSVHLYRDHSYSIGSDGIPGCAWSIAVEVGHAKCARVGTGAAECCKVSDVGRVVVGCPTDVITSRGAGLGGIEKISEFDALAID